VNKTVIAALRAGFSVHEPFLEGILRAFYARRLRDLKSKTRIFLPDGCYLMGVLDETGTLDYGQVFVQFTDPKTGDLRVITGDIVVTKPPCLHRGDVRVLQAINVPSLRHIHDCIVFPAKGPRPHPNECSGSDLDGDLYLVSWDPSIIPKRENLYTPADYPPAVPKIGEVTIYNIIQFFADYIENDALGMIANAHMAISDHSAMGVNDSRAITLAGLHSIAVDFPKTGVPANIPNDVRTDKFPDFMEKKNKATYESVKIIGQLYRKVKEPATQLAYTTPITVDRQLIIEGLERYLDDARINLAEYEFQLQSIMNQYGIKHESEVISGNILKFHKYLKKREQETTETIRKTVFNLKKEFRGRFDDEFHDLDQDFEGNLDILRQAKASAWYYAVYERNEKIIPFRKNEIFLSFAWIVFDILIQIKQENCNIEGRKLA